MPSIEGKRLKSTFWKVQESSGSVHARAKNGAPVMAEGRSMSSPMTFWKILERTELQNRSHVTAKGLSMPSLSTLQYVLLRTFIQSTLAWDHHGPSYSECQGPKRPFTKGSAILPAICRSKKGLHTESEIGSMSSVRRTSYLVQCTRRERSSHARTKAKLKREGRPKHALISGNATTCALYRTQDEAPVQRPRPENVSSRTKFSRESFIIYVSCPAMAKGASHTSAVGPSTRLLPRAQPSWPSSFLILWILYQFAATNTLEIPEKRRHVY